MTQLTFIFIAHKDFQDIGYFLKVVNHLSKYDFSYCFAFDNPLPIEVEELLIENDIRFIVNSTNIGKLTTIVRCVKECVHTRWFKIIDWDDVVDIRKLKDLARQVNRLESLNDEKDVLIEHKGAKFKDASSKLFGYQSLNRFVLLLQQRKSKDFNWAKVPNAKAIYPSRVIKESHDFPKTRQQFFNDDLLSAYVLGRGAKRVRLSSNFYIQFHAAGQTSETSFDRLKSLDELYCNYMLLSEGNFDFGLVGLSKDFCHKDIKHLVSKSDLTEVDKKNVLSSLLQKADALFQ